MRGDGRPFTFSKVDIYSRLTMIPWTMTGRRNGVVVFSSAATQPHTYGNYATIANSQPTALIDTLEITITNPAVSWSCPSAPCTNPEAIDNIVVSY